MTVKQCAVALEISPQRVYALIAAGTLAHTKLGTTRLVSRRSMMLYRESPSRNKFAGGLVRPVNTVVGPTLFDDVDDVAGGDEEEWSGAKPPLLSTEARRLYDASPLGKREARTQGDRGLAGGV